MLGETGNVPGDRLKPVQAVFSGGKLDDSAADSVHGDDLERVFPKSVAERRKGGERDEFHAAYFKKCK